MLKNCIYLGAGRKEVSNCLGVGRKKVKEEIYANILMQILWQKKRDTLRNAKCQYSCIIKEQERVKSYERWIWITESELAVFCSQADFVFCPKSTHIIVTTKTQMLHALIYNFKYKIGLNKQTMFLSSFLFYVIATFQNIN